MHTLPNLFDASTKVVGLFCFNKNGVKVDKFFGPLIVVLSAESGYLFMSVHISELLILNVCLDILPLQTAIRGHLIPTSFRILQIFLWDRVLETQLMGFYIFNR